MGQTSGLSAGRSENAQPQRGRPVTIGWAIVIVAVLYLLDKYGVLKRTAKVAGIVAVIGASVFAVILAISYISDLWKDHKFAKTHECFDPAIGKAHSANESSPWCADNEQVREHVTFDPSVTIDPSTIKPITPAASRGADADGWEPVPPPPTGFVPHASVITFDSKPTTTDLFRRPREKKYSKAICYDENTGKASHLKKEGDACKTGSILMEEVKSH